MTKKITAVTVRNQAPATRVADAILGFIAKIPDTSKRASNDPATASRELATRAAAKAGVIAGSLALPPGPLGWLTLIPELTAVWRIQAQLVADIAAIHGKEASLNREQMLYCLFRHTVAQAFRDLVVRAGERLLIRHASLRVLQNVAQLIGVRITQQLIGKGISRWLPAVGAAAVGAYAYFDTQQVAATAIALFEQEFDVEAETKSPRHLQTGAT
jgi:hypothetical protein